MNPLPGRLVLLGHPVAHSLSPIFQAAALRAAGIPLHYEAIDVRPDDLAGVLLELRDQRAAGNVTLPHKPRVAEACDEITPEVLRSRAVNCFTVAADGRLIGHNTDVGGFHALASRMLGDRPHGLRVALLGAGGAATAVLTAIERWPGCTVALHNRTLDRAAAVAARFPDLVAVASSAAEACENADVVVNGTSVGLYDDTHPAPLDILPAGAVVLDLVYRPEETAWVRSARARGHSALDGLAMLVEQGALAFEFWFGVEAPREAMWHAVNQRREESRTG